MPARISLDTEGILRMYASGISQEAIAKAYGVNRKTIEKRIAEHVNVMNQPRVNRLNQKGTLCWYCRRAAGPIRDRCSWAEAFRPVEGWTATQTLIIDKDTLNDRARHVMQSYHVYDCPLFWRDDRRRERYDWLPDHDSESDEG